MKQRLLFVLMLLVLSGLLPSAPVLADVTPKLNGRIAFASSRTGHSEIYVMDADGSNIKQLTQDASKASYSPAWSSDGKYLFYISKVEGQPSIGMMMTIDGSYQRTIGDYFVDTRATLSFSPDGQQFVFARNVAEEAGESDLRRAFYISDMQGNKTRKILLPQKVIYRVAFLSNERLLIVARDGLYNIDLYSTDLYGHFRRTLVLHAGIAFAVAPDSKRIVTTAELGTKFITLDPDGANLITIADWGFPGPALGFVEWSPDAKMMWTQQAELVESTDIRKQSELHYAIYTLNADGSNQSKIVTQFRVPLYASWSPDSQYLTYAMAAAYGEKRQIVIARPDGTTVKTFTSDSDDAQPVWQPMPTN